MTTVAYIWPVNKRPSFAWGRYPSGGYHPAYDFAVPTGTDVHAPASGNIIQIGWDSTGYGIHVRIRHSNGHMSILAHLDYAVVKVGQYVRQGQLVAYSDNTGNSTGPHLHWETRTSVTGSQRSTAYDPGPYIGAGAPFTGQLPDGPTGPGDPGYPTVPNPAWYGTTPGVVILPAAPTITGTKGPVEPRFSPARIAA